MWIKEDLECPLPMNIRTRFVHAGRESYLPDAWKYFSKLKPHKHDALHMVILIKGKNHFRLNGQEVYWEAPSGILISSNEPHEIRPMSPGAIEYLQITFNILNKSGDSIPEDWGALARSLDNKTEFPKSIEKESWQKAIPDMMAAISALEHENALALSGKLLSLIGELSCPMPQKLPVCINELQELVSNDLNFPWDLNALASACNWSSGYLTRRFHTFFNCTPMEWVYRRRMERACALLIEGALDLSGIAEICGFSDAYHLSRRFKNYYGMPPATWRRVYSTSMDVSEEP